ncbi:MAG: TylF/MycF/NovP-related O-methyltransferase [Thermogutta sp.]
MVEANYSYGFGPPPPGKEIWWFAPFTQILNSAMFFNLKKAIKSAIQRTGFEIRRLPRTPRGQSPYELVTPLADYAPWKADEEFLRAYQAVRYHTLVDIYRCWELWMLVEQAAKVPGAILEVGVWRGGTGVLIAYRASQIGITDPVYLCDTFSGVVKAGDEDSYYRGGEHADTSVAIVEALAESLGVTNIRILQGIFPEETCSLVEAASLRFCHIDVDTHNSARDILLWVWPRLSHHGLVVYDDFGFRACPGITRHVETQIPLGDRLVFHNLNGHAIVVKMQSDRSHQVRMIQNNKRPAVSGV